MGLPRIRIDPAPVVHVTYPRPMAATHSMLPFPGSLLDGLSPNVDHRAGLDLRKPLGLQHKQ